MLARQIKGLGWMNDLTIYETLAESWCHAGSPLHLLAHMNPARFAYSLNLSQFVARQYWRKRWATRHRFRARCVENGTFESGASRSLRINFNHLQILIAQFIAVAQFIILCSA
jgi:hypothetical protein